MHHLRQHLVDHPKQRRSQIGGHLHRSSVSVDRDREELAGRGDVAALGQVHVKDPIVLIDSSVHVAPDTGNFHIGLIDEPVVTNSVTARFRCFDQLRRESLHPPVDGDVINLETAFREEFLNVAIRQSVAQLPAHRQQYHLWWEPEPRKRSGLSMAAGIHENTIVKPTSSVNATVLFRVG